MKKQKHAMQFIPNFPSAALGFPKSKILRDFSVGFTYNLEERLSQPKAFVNISSAERQGSLDRRSWRESCKTRQNAKKWAGIESSLMAKTWIE